MDEWPLVARMSLPFFLAAFSVLSTHSLSFASGLFLLIELSASITLDGKLMTIGMLLAPSQMQIATWSQA